jgi:putative transposase
LGLEESTFHYRSQRGRDDSLVKKHLREIADKKPRAGRPYMIWYLRERLKMTDNHKRIARIYREMGLQVTKRPKRKRRAARGHIFIAPSRPNEIWAMDFVSDSFSNGRRFRIFTLKDIFTHESLCLYVDRSIPGHSVANQLNKVISQRRAKPEGIICDNGSEFVSRVMDQWEAKTEVQLRFIDPGKPIQNAFIESFNGKLRAECLDQNWFTDLEDARKTIEKWRIEYNTDRPTKPLGKLTPIEFAKQHGVLV